MSDTIEEIRKNYAGFSNEKLMRIAKESLNSLTPEAAEVLKEELVKRNMSTDTLVESINLQAKKLTDVELEPLINLIESLPCPICNRSFHQLNLSSIFTVHSYIIATSSKGKNIIACPDCLIKSLKKANVTTAIWGWWGIPTGVLESTKALIHNSISKKRVHQRNPLLKEFVKLNLEVIEKCKTDSKSLVALLKENNAYSN